MRPFSILAVLLLAACAPPAEKPPDVVPLPTCETAGAPTTLDALFEAHFAKTQATGCTASGCHGSGAGALTFTTAHELWAATVEQTSRTDPTRQIVAPGDPRNSVLLRRIHASAGSARMPQGGPYLDDQAVAAVTAWICAGAKEPEADPAPDAGTPPDAGDAGDAGETSDAGEEPDAGVDPDAGVELGPTVDGFAPESGVAGTPVLIEGTGFAVLAEENAVTFGGEVAEVTEASTTRLRALVPVAAASGTIRVTVAGRSATSAQTFQVIVPNPSPQLDSISPTSVPVGAATTLVTLEGSGFVALTTVVLEGENLATEFVSATRLRATVPAAKLATAGERSVFVVSPGPGGGTSAIRIIEVQNPAPAIARFEPTRVELGTTALAVLAHGSGFGAATTATANGTALASTFVSGATLRLQLPASLRAAAGSLTVTLSNAGPGGGATTATLEVVHPAPLATSLTPPEVGADGVAHEVQLRGSGFVAASQVRVDATPVPTTYVDSTTLVATLGASFAAQGRVFAVTVVTPLPGGGTSPPLSWTVRNPSPALLALGPTTVPVDAAPVRLTVTGSSFNMASEVLLDGLALATTFVSSTTLEVTLPTFVVAETHTVSVRNPAPGGGTSGSEALEAELFTQPTITGLVPQPAPAGQAFTLTVQGAGFACGATPSRIALDSGEIPATTCTGTALSATVGPFAAGLVAVRVRNTSQALESAEVTLTVVTPNPQPTVTTLSPTSGVVGALPPVLTVRGTGFVAASRVTIDGAPRPSTFVSATELIAELSSADLAAAGARQVRVVSPGPGGGTSAPTNFPVFEPNPVPAISALEPASTLAGIGALALTVRGSGFVASSAATVDGTARPVTFVSATELRVAVAAADTAAAGSRAILVSSPAPGGGTSGSFGWPVIQPNPVPVLTSVSPASVLIGSGAQQLTLLGPEFLAGSSALVDGSPRTTTFVSATELRVTLGASDTATAGTLSLQVRTPAPGGGTSAAKTMQIVNPAPELAAFTPAMAIAGATGFTITLNGSGFVATSVVRIGGSARTTRLVNSTQLAADLLAGDVATAGTFDVTVATPAPGGGVTAALSLQVNNAAPTISSLSPASRVAGANTFTLVVTGTGFVAGSTVQWAGAARTTTFGSRTRLDAIINAADVATPGSALVTVLSPAPGGGTSAGSLFTITVPPNPVPIVSALSPCGRVAGGGAFTLTISGSGFMSGTTVAFAGTSLAATLVNSTTLQVNVPAAAVATSPADAALDVQLTNPPPGGGDSNGFIFGLASAVSTMAGNVEPILASRCLDCHSWNRSNLLGGSGCGVPLVTACGPLTSQSYLIAKITGVDICGSQMPANGPPLSSTQIQTIIDWVAQGAPD